MQNDKTTLRDLSIFSPEGGTDVFRLVDHATTQAGRDMLRKHIQHPPDTFEQLQEVQDTVKFWTVHPDLWPNGISNGTLVMLEKFFESADGPAAPAGILTLSLDGFFQKIFNKQEYFYIRFSLSHLSDLLKGCEQLARLCDVAGIPALLHREATLMNDELKHRLCGPVSNVNQQTKYAVLARLSHDARREMKKMAYRLINSYARMDAWQSMAKATMKQQWVFPVLKPALPICLDIEGLYHPLLQNPVAHNIHLDSNQNFVLLTGANMSGKTTFMRSLGVAAVLAHLGMGVPAQAMRLSFLHGIITQMQVEDNILRGESYFFAEVKRMKQTSEKILQPEPQLALMDELFKGTNVHDAYECTKAVVEGLLKHPNHLMILSTHLYEVALQYKDNRGILFSYFVTDTTENGGYNFSYQLAEGISDDRIGYRILQQEGVIDLLNSGNNRKMD